MRERERERPKTILNYNILTIWTRAKTPLGTQTHHYILSLLWQVNIKEKKKTVNNSLHSCSQLSTGHLAQKGQWSGCCCHWITWQVHQLHTSSDWNQFSCTTQVAVRRGKYLLHYKDHLCIYTFTELPVKSFVQHFFRQSGATSEPSWTWTVWGKEYIS